MSTLSSWKDKALFTPGPLTTSATTKQAMLRDLGSRDVEFISTVKTVREKLVEMGNGADQYTAILMQGSGTFGIEATLSSVIPPQGKLLILINGAYGQRMAKIAEIHRIQSSELICSENMVPDASALESSLESDP